MLVGCTLSVGQWADVEKDDVLGAEEVKVDNARLAVIEANDLRVSAGGSSVVTYRNTVAANVVEDYERTGHAGPGLFTLHKKAHKAIRANLQRV